MSISHCKHCDKQYDQDFEVEHEEMCGEEEVDETKEIKKNLKRANTAMNNYLDSMIKKHETE